MFLSTTAARKLDRALSAAELKKIRLSEQAHYPSGKILLADCDAYPPAPGYDPEFKRKLTLTAEYVEDTTGYSTKLKLVEPDTASGTD